MFNNQLKKVFFFSIFSLSVLDCSAQIAQFGIKGGVNYSNFSNNKFDTKAITNYHIGPTVNIKLIKGVRAQAEVLYSTIGAKYKKPFEEITTEYKNELGYLSLPILLQFDIRENIYLELGPQFSFLLKNKDDFNFKNDNSYDLGLIGGIGFKLLNRVNVGARYIGGTKDVYPDFKSKTNVIQAFIEIKI